MSATAPQRSAVRAHGRAMSPAARAASILHLPELVRGAQDDACRKYVRRKGVGPYIIAGAASLSWCWNSEP